MNLKQETMTLEEFRKIKKEQAADKIIAYCKEAGLSYDDILTVIKLAREKISTKLFTCNIDKSCKDSSRFPDCGSCVELNKP